MSLSKQLALNYLDDEESSLLAAAYMQLQLTKKKTTAPEEVCMDESVVATPSVIRSVREAYGGAKAGRSEELPQLYASIT
jgi:hypothetical protein